MRTHFAVKGRLLAWAFDTVDWEALGNAVAIKPKLIQLWAAKFASGFCGTGKMLRIYGVQTDNTCQCCTNEDIVEDKQHVLLCPAPQIRARCQHGITKITGCLWQMAQEDTAWALEWLLTTQGVCVRQW